MDESKTAICLYGGGSVFYEPDVSDTRYTLSCPGVGAVKATESQHLSMRIDGGSFALNKQLELFWVYKDSGREVSPLVAITFLHHWKERFFISPVVKETKSIQFQMVYPMTSTPSIQLLLSGSSGNEQP